MQLSSREGEVIQNFRTFFRTFSLDKGRSTIDCSKGMLCISVHPWLILELLTNTVVVVNQDFHERGDSSKVIRIRTDQSRTIHLLSIPALIMFSKHCCRPWQTTVVSMSSSLPVITVCNHSPSDHYIRYTYIYMINTTKQWIQSTFYLLLHIDILICGTLRSSVDNHTIVIVVAAAVVLVVAKLSLILTSTTISQHNTHPTLSNHKEK